MEIRKVGKYWDDFGKQDPFWAILTDPAKKGNKWDSTEFFASGEREIDSAMRHLREVGAAAGCGKALDFGCGVGRLTQALVKYFEEVSGVDIAPSMIAKAQEFNRYPGKCRYYVNATDDLSRFPGGSFDLIYAHIVFQHMEPRYAKKYLREFMRLLAPGGIMIFQLPSFCRDWAVRLKERLRSALPFLYGAFVRLKYGDQPIIEMHVIPRNDVLSLIGETGGTIVEVSPDRSCGETWESFRYIVRKTQSTKEGS
jgi:SAM-dependent methyltransferase